MSTEQLDGEPIGHVWDTGEGDLTSVSLIIASEGKLVIGDMITFAGVRLDPWWKRVLRWMRLLPPAEELPLQRFLVTWSSDEEP